MRPTIWNLCVGVSILLITHLPAVGQEDIEAELKKVVAEIESVAQEMKAASDAQDPDRYDELKRKWDELNKQMEELKEKLQATLESDVRAGALFKEGRGHFMAGRYSAAVKSYKELLALDPSNATAFYMLGVAHQKLRDYDQARSAFEKAVQIDTSYALAHVALGNLAARQRDEQATLKYYRRAIELDSTQVKAYYGIGNVHLRAKRYEEAEAYYRHATELNPEYADAWIGLGRALTEQGRAEAVPVLQRAVQINPRSWQGNHHLAVALNKQGAYLKALLAADNCLAYKTAYAAAWYEKGFALMNLGRKKEAVTAFEEAKKDRAWREISEHYIKKCKGLIE